MDNKFNYKFKGQIINYESPSLTDADIDYLTGIMVAKRENPSTQGINESTNVRFLQTVRHIWLPPRLSAISCFLPRLSCSVNTM